MQQFVHYFQAAVGHLSFPLSEELNAASSQLNPPNLPDQFTDEICAALRVGASPILFSARLGTYRVYGHGNVIRLSSPHNNIPNSLWT